MNTQFYDGQYDSAADKEKILKAMTRFIASGFKDTLFTKALHQYLYLSFGFIAHYNRNGFFRSRFADPLGRIQTLKAIKNASRWNFIDDNCSGRADLNKAIQSLVIENESLFLESAKKDRVNELTKARDLINQELDLLSTEAAKHTNRRGETTDAPEIDASPIGIACVK